MMHQRAVARDELFAALIAEFSDTTDADRLLQMEQLLAQIARERTAGDVVELGCYNGATSVWIRHTLEKDGPQRRDFHVYDSFQGLPKPGVHDTYLNEGEVAASIDEFTATFSRFGARLPTIHPGWFEATLPAELPDLIAFAYLDGDFYDSIRVSLEAVYPHMSPGGLIVVDDYADTAVNPRAWDGLPGVKKAVDDFMKDKSETAKVLFGEGDLAFGLIERQ